MFAKIGNLGSFSSCEVRCQLEINLDLSSVRIADDHLHCSRVYTSCKKQAHECVGAFTTINTGEANLMNIFWMLLKKNVNRLDIIHVPAIPLGNRRVDLVISRFVANNSTDLVLDLTIWNDFHGNDCRATYGRLRYQHSDGLFNAAADRKIDKYAITLTKPLAMQIVNGWFSCRRSCLL
jgi:hypothetical protein